MMVDALGLAIFAVENLAARAEADLQQAERARGAAIADGSASRTPNYWKDAHRLHRKHEALRALADTLRDERDLQRKAGAR